MDGEWMVVWSIFWVIFLKIRRPLWFETTSAGRRRLEMAGTVGIGLVAENLGSPRGLSWLRGPGLL